MPNRIAESNPPSTASCVAPFRIVIALALTLFLQCPSTTATALAGGKRQQISLRGVVGGSPGAVYHALSSQWAQVNVRLMNVGNATRSEPLYQAVPLGNVGVVVSPEAAIRLAYDPDVDALSVLEGSVQSRIAGNAPLAIGECPLANASLGERAVYKAGRKGRSFAVELPGVTVAFAREWIQQIRAYSTHITIILSPEDPCAVPLHGLLVMQVEDQQEADDATSYGSRGAETDDDREKQKKALSDDSAGVVRDYGLIEGSLSDYEEPDLFSTTSQFSLAGYEPAAE